MLNGGVLVLNTGDCGSIPVESYQILENWWSIYSAWERDKWTQGV